MGLKTNTLSNPIKTSGNFGNLFAINSNYVWDLFCFPKIIDINTGEIVEQSKGVNSGKQHSAIINAAGDFPSIIFNKQTKQVAIKGEGKIEVLTPDLNYLTSII
jgi:hypothetical protein